MPLQEAPTPQAAASTSEPTVPQDPLDFQESLSGLFDKLQGWLDALIEGLPNFVLAIIIVLLAVFIARLARKIVQQLMSRVSSYHAVNKLLSTLAYVAVLTVGVVVALGVLNLNTVVATILGGAGVLGLAIGFASQDIAANFISGILMSVRRPFREGEIIETNGTFGTVDEINLRATHIYSFQGQLTIIPNKEVFQNPIVNYSRRGERRIDLSCGVAYGDDLEQAKKVALDAIKGLDYLKEGKNVDLYYNEFGDSSINFVLRYWVDFSKQTDYLQAQSDGIMALKKAFDANGITIPFPIRTLDFGVVGGERLDEILPQRFYQDGGEA